MLRRLEALVEEASYAFAYWLLRRYQKKTVEGVGDIFETIEMVGAFWIIFGVLTGPFIMAAPCSFKCSQPFCDGCVPNPYMILAGISIVVLTVIFFLIGPIVSRVFDRVLKRGIWADT